MFPLKCAVQTYAWGKQGCDSKVAQLMKNDDNFVVDDNTMYAEVIHCWVWGCLMDFLLMIYCNQCVI